MKYSQATGVGQQPSSTTILYICDCRRISALLFQPDHGRHAAGITITPEAEK
jgi:hypothetical protein